MKVAYLILAHHAPEMLAALIAALDKPKSQVFVHIDRKTDITPFKELLADKCIFVTPRINVSWGSFSIVQATINLLEAALSTNNFDYYCLLSGCDYPVKPVRAFEAHLTTHAGNEYMSSQNMNKLPPKFKKRYTGFFLFENRSEFIKRLNFGITKIQRLFYKRKPYANRSMFNGAQWWALTGACVKYIMDFITAHPDYISYFKYTHIPDTSFFQTLVMHSPYVSKVQNDSLRHIVFENEKIPHPKIWTMDDKDELLQSPAYFARKFDLATDSGIVDFFKNCRYYE
jgi:hypothetical protein